VPVDPSAIATWANLVTVARVLIAPLMFWLIPDGTGSTGMAWVAFVLWFLLCSSDGIDGYLARRHGTTTFGTYLDPLADKILVLGAMFTLVSRDVFWIVPVVIIAVRELTISLYRTFVGAKGVSVPASKLAKWKTLTQQLAVGFAIMPITDTEAPWLWKGLLWVSVVLAVVSAAQYFWRAHAGKRPSTPTPASVS
jgi:CDP-diacylglycerol---glycerol-3-phosphate 3-phosphatidyltransferase